MENRIHIVFNQKHRQAATQFRQQRNKGYTFRAAQSRHGFIEQQELWLAGKGNSQLQQAQFPVRQIGSRYGSSVGKTNALQCRQRNFIQRDLARSVAEKTQAGARFGLRGNGGVFQRREAGQDRGNLKCSTEACLYAPGDRHLRDVLSIQQYMPGIRPQDT